jgi:peptide/nickel transport system ATP-binding protein
LIFNTTEPERPSHDDGNGGLLEVRDLTISYRTRTGYTRAVDGVSFRINKGQILGLAGESGCGKSTTALAIMRLHGPSVQIAGQILFEDRDILQMSDDEVRSCRWKEISMIPQGSMNSLDPVIPVGDQIVEAILAHEHMSRHEVWRMTEKLLSSVSISPSRAKNYPHEFSGGMKQRSIIAMALALSPRLVIADEPTTALDVVVQKQLLALLRSLRKQLDIAFLFVTHDLSVIGEVADRIAVMYAGKIAEIGETEAVLRHPSHPYTEALVGSVPRVFGPRQMLNSIPGSPPVAQMPTGCRFHPRCRRAFEICKERDPQMFLSKTGALAACHLYSIGRQ